MQFFQNVYIFFELIMFVINFRGKNLENIPAKFIKDLKLIVFCKCTKYVYQIEKQESNVENCVVSKSTNERTSNISFSKTCVVVENEKQLIIIIIDRRVILFTLRQNPFIKLCFNFFLSRVG